MILDTWFSVLSDLLINLAAGWLGAVVIIPAIAESPKRVNPLMLTGNILFAIFALVIAFELRRFVGL